MSLNFGAFDERDNKNLYCTPQEIDDRQAIELLRLLERWEKKEIDPCRVLHSVNAITGARANFLISYQVALEFEENSEELFRKIQRTSGRMLSQTERETLEQERTGHRIESEQKIKEYLRPEIVDRDSHEQTVVTNIQAIRQRLETAEFDSWAAATALAEVLLAPPSATPQRDFTSSHPLREFQNAIKEEKERCEAQTQNVEATLKSFEPESEASIKGALARHFAEKRAFEDWIAKKGTKDERRDEWLYDLEGRPGAPKQDEVVKLIPPINYPTDRKLCDQLHIAPSGTGLIEVYDDRQNEGFEKDIYGNPVARITTYSVSFAPKRPEDLPALKAVVEEALVALSSVPYKYDLPGFTASGESYKRVRNPKEHYHSYDYATQESSFVDVVDNKVQPLARFDLDDLWVLYYLVEPVIEPNAQIAAAMNAARYAEERGAIMKPSDFNYLSDGHEVRDQSGYLKDTSPEQMLNKAMSDSFTDLALRKIDMAGFLARVGTLANHTLTGRVEDASGRFVTYDRMIADARKDDKPLAPYEVAWKDRTREVLSHFLGLKDDDQRPIHVVLAAAIREIAEPLRRKYRHAERLSEEHFRTELDRRSEERWTRAINRSEPDIFQKIKAKMEEIEQADAASDRNAGVSYDDIKKVKDGLTLRSNLVLADSEVETCIDGVHADGRYISRTKGSPFQRKELPIALQSFVASERSGPNIRALFHQDGPVA